MTRSSLLIAMVLFIGMPVFAMIRTLPFPDLVKTAEAILIARIDSQEVLTEPGKDIPNTKTSLIIEKVLKGSLQANDPLQFTTPGSKEHPVRDRPVFQDKGERVLLYLIQNKEGVWCLNNGIQGLWPLESGTDKTLGMGFNYSIKKIEEELAK
ncbi:MAG: hypothetical protein KKB51_03715 [Candidatus Riflebacteria bacterium]|nr:hypothetical protein [Candidatus Riflebacteria bacterium]